MKTVKILKNNLTSDEFNKWEYNINTFSGDCHKKELLSMSDLELYDIINGSFVWYDTDEGYMYWYKIANRKELIKMDLKKIKL